MTINGAYAVNCWRFMSTLVDRKMLRYERLAPHTGLELREKNSINVISKVMSERKRKPNGRERVSMHFYMRIQQVNA